MGASLSVSAESWDENNITKMFSFIFVWDCRRNGEKLQNVL